MEDIAKRFQRLLWILQQLSTPGGTTSGRLADLYRVSQRTIQRDIIDLRAASFDIRSRGRRHCLDASQAVPGQSVDVSEALSFALGSALFTSGQERVKMSSGEGELSGNQALLRLAAFVKGEKKIEVGTGNPAAALGVASPREPWFHELTAAITESRTVRFSYQALGRLASSASDEAADALGERKAVDPWSLLYQASGWYLQGYDHSRGEPSTFKLGRIRRLETSGQTFAVPAQHRADGSVFHRWDLIEGRKRKVLCRVSADLAAWLEENPVHPSQTIEDGMLELQVRDLDRVAGWILSLPGIEVLQPSDLRVRVRQRAQEMVERHRQRALLPQMPTPTP